MMRHRGKQILTKIFSVAGLAALTLAVCTGLVSAQSARVTQLFVTDPLTSVALGGYDAVSYFTQGEPVLGQADHEYYWQGVSWFFASAANRDVFARDPDIYAPQFGGHGTMSMSRGYLSDGNPQIFIVLDNRLFLFYSQGNRDAFMQAENTARVRAMERWKVAAANLPNF